jgi:hypothetical protein
LTSGEGLLKSFFRAQRCAKIFFILTLAVAASRFATESLAAGAFAIGKCGAYGQAYDFAGEDLARAAALKQCKGECPTTLTMSAPAPRSPST